MTQLPDGYRVELDAYSGPLDLLLYLVRRHEIDLNNIPIAKLTDQYLNHLKIIEVIDVERAGEFLVMAATLLEIKSQMLMPREEGDESDPTDAIEEENDPRFKLVQQLLAYKRYKDAAIALESRQETWASRHAIHLPPRPKEATDPDNAPAIEIDLEDADVMDLCEAFARIMDSVGSRATQHEVTYDDTPLSLHAADIQDRLTREGAMTLKQIFIGRQNRSEMIGLFLAMLELVRDRKVRVEQDVDRQDITLAMRPESEWIDSQQIDDDDHHDWRDAETGEVQYDWPDEQSKKRAERRAKLRATIRKKRARADSDSEECSDPDELANDDDLIDELDELEDDFEDDTDDEEEDWDVDEEEDGEDWDDDEEEADEDDVEDDKR